MDEVRKVIDAEAKFTWETPAFPISYATSFVKVNALASANYSTDYVETKASIHKESNMQVEQRGGFYLNQFKVDNYLIKGFDGNGNPITEYKKYYDEGMSAPSVVDIRNMSARVLTGPYVTADIWGGVKFWNAVRFPLASEYKVEMRNTSLHPRYRVHADGVKIIDNGY